MRGWKALAEFKALPWPYDAELLVWPDVVYYYVHHMLSNSFSSFMSKL